AYKRGNSVYFPDRVVPMLPEELSNGWCSLRPNEERPTLAAHMWIDADGNLLRHKFGRALIKSAARTTYTQIQKARDGDPDELTTPLLDTVIAPLYGAFESLKKSRAHRGVLELDLTERQIILDDDGNVDRVITRDSFDSHKLIEEFMILANVAAAQTLEKAKQPCMYRIHDEPSPEKISALKEFLDSVSIPFTKGQIVRSKHFNQILTRVKGTAESEMVSAVVLRSQARAEYNPDNVGHFGLALDRYCHFTSPIRRYADLLVHRALVRGLKLGEGPLEEDHKPFVEMGEHLSVAERNAAGAERDAVDRFAALYLSEKVGQVMPGRINGVTRFGLFITLDESGADGLVPIRTLPDDYYVHDEHRHTLRGRQNNMEFRLGDTVEVLITEANPISGSTVFQIMEGGKPGKKRTEGKGDHRTAPKRDDKGGRGGFKRKPKKSKGKSRASRRRESQNKNKS
ncbi:ribonuclease R family protein, partial [Pseudomonadota bacterium]